MEKNIGELFLNIEMAVMWSEMVLEGVMARSPIDIVFIWWVLYIEHTHTNNTWFLGRQPCSFQTHCLCQKQLWICDCLSVHLQKRGLENFGFINSFVYLKANIPRWFLGWNILLVSMTPAFGEESSGHDFFLSIII